MSSRILSIVLSLPPILLALTVHEYFHGYIAYRLGDPTAKYSGRLTLNPLKHIDPFGLIALVIFRIGWAKPVPINPYNFRDIKQGVLYSSLAGPLSNFILAIPFGILLRIVPNDSNILFPLWLMIGAGLVFNLILCIFNLLPVPPLDGSHILFSLLPPKYSYIETWLRQYGFFILIGLILVNAIGIPILGLWIWPFVSLFGQLFAGSSSFYAFMTAFL